MEGIDYGAANFWWQVAMTFALVVNFIYQWITGRDKVTQAAIEQAEAEFDRQLDSVRKEATAQGSRLLALETYVHTTLNQNTIQELFDKLSATNRELGELQQKLQSTNHLLNTVHGHLLARD